MELKQQVENLIEQLRPLMPSNGTWPFTVMKLNRYEFKGLGVQRAVNADYQLLFLLRTDFNMIDLVDYVRNSREFSSMPWHQQDAFLIDYVSNMKSRPALLNWCESITNIGLGIAIGLSEQLDLCIEHISADFSELDAHFSFQTKNLKAFQLFDIYYCKD